MVGKNFSLWWCFPEDLDYCGGVLSGCVLIFTNTAIWVKSELRCFYLVFFLCPDFYLPLLCPFEYNVLIWGPARRLFDFTVIFDNGTLRILYGCWCLCGVIMVAYALQILMLFHADDPHGFPKHCHLNEIRVEMFWPGGFLVTHCTSWCLSGVDFSDESLVECIEPSHSNRGNKYMCLTLLMVPLTFSLCL